MTTWFMVYRWRLWEDIGDNSKLGNWSTCNCTTKKHPVLEIKEWNKNASGQVYQYVLLFYDKLPDDVVEQVGDIGFGFHD